ncbi:TPA: hypothetical protein ACMD2S_004539 [Vibrio parahaemolyticus]
MTYEEKFDIAVSTSNELGISPRIVEKFPIDERNVDFFRNLVEHNLLGMLIERFGVGDWGNQCMNVSAQLFTILQHYNIPCELTYGDVHLGEKGEYAVSKSILVDEWHEVSDKEGLPIHVWITIGKDFIIDPTISSRIHTDYDSSGPLNHLLVAEAQPLKNETGIVYTPFLVGKNYLEKIADIPLDYISQMQMA